MANTVAVAKEIEKFIQNELTKEYNQIFSEKKVKIGEKKDGEPAVYKFDAVSKDERIVAGVKSHSGRTKTGKFPRAKIGMTYTDIFFLSLTKAKEKLLILTSKEFYELFVKDSDGKIPGDIEIR